MSDIARALAHQRAHHQRTRVSGFVPHPSAEGVERRRADRLAAARRALGDALDGLDPRLQEAIVERTAAFGQAQGIDTLAGALPTKTEPVPHGLEGCGDPTPEEREILAAGKLVRVRSDDCNDPGCRLLARPWMTPDRHARAHARAAETLAGQA